MEDINWFSKQLEKLDNEIRNLKYWSRSLQEYRKEIRGAWADEASRDINTRFFSPHQRDDNDFRTAVDGVFENLKIVNRQLAPFAELSLKIEDLSMEIDKMLKTASEDIERSHSSLDSHADNMSEAREQLARAFSSIDKANAACG